MEKKRLTPQQAFQKICNYCVYQERSHKEVKNKLYEYGLWKNEVEDILSQLITEGFLNEQRFANAFAGGKFRIKKWGRLKIKQELEAHGLTSKCIQIGLKEIDDQSYHTALESLVKKKWSLIDEPSEFRKKDKVARYVISKGYESDLVWGILKQMEP